MQGFEYRTNEHGMSNHVGTRHAMSLLRDSIFRVYLFNILKVYAAKENVKHSSIDRETFNISFT